MQSNLKLADPLDDECHRLTFSKQSRSAKQGRSPVKIQHVLLDRLEGPNTGPNRSFANTLTRDHWGEFASVYTGSRKPNEFVRRSLEHFIAELLQRLTDEPLMDGIDHPGLDLITIGIAKYSAAALERLEAIVLGRRGGPASDVLRLLARTYPGSPDWRAKIVQKALASHSIEIRDAAVQACESWAEKSLLPLLRSHRETEAWLDDYARRVVRDLEE